MIFHSHANKSQFHKRGCTLGLILKVRVFRTRKWLTGSMNYDAWQSIFIIFWYRSFLIVSFSWHNKNSLLICIGFTALAHIFYLVLIVDLKFNSNLTQSNELRNIPHSVNFGNLRMQLVISWSAVVQLSPVHENITFDHSTWKLVSSTFPSCYYSVLFS